MGPGTPARSRPRYQQKPNHPEVKGRTKAGERQGLTATGAPASPPSPPLPGARGWTGASAHRQHAGVGRHSEAGPVVVGLEHGQTRGRTVGVGCGGRERRQRQRLPRATKGNKCHGHPTVGTKVATGTAGLPPAAPARCSARPRRPRLLPDVDAGNGPGSPSVLCHLWTWSPTIARWGFIIL